MIRRPRLANLTARVLTLLITSAAVVSLIAYPSTDPMGLALRWFVAAAGAALLVTISWISNDAPGGAGGLGGEGGPGDPGGSGGEGGAGGAGSPGGRGGQGSQGGAGRSGPPGAAGGPGGRGGDAIPPRDERRARE